jgi:regulator of sigma E protease
MGEGVGMQFAQFGVAGLVMICVLIVVHELGHWVAARIFGIGTPIFSVGIGPRIFGYRFMKTDFRVSAIPVGGYVLMSGADPFGEEDPDVYCPPEENFMLKPIWQRLIVMVAGPGVNIVLPFFLFVAVLMLGRPQADGSIGYVVPGSVAEEVGFQSGDIVTNVGDEPVDVWSDLWRALDDQPGEAASIVLQRDEETLRLDLPGTAVVKGEDGYISLSEMGIQSGRLSSRVGISDLSSPAALAGLETGDGIVEVDGQDVVTWMQMQEHLANGGTHRITYRRAVNGEIATLETMLKPVAGWRPAPDEPLANPYGLIPIMVFVGEIVDDSAAQDAKMKSNDRVYAIDGMPVRSWSDVVQLVQASVEELTADAEPRPLELSLIRDGQPIALTFTPRVTRELVPMGVRFRPIIGIKPFPQMYREGPRKNKYYSVFEAVPVALDQCNEAVRGIFRGLGNLITGTTKITESLGGPVAIFNAAGAAAQRGLFDYVEMMAMISFSLGIINLLPVPVLDGGQIVFYLIEGIRGRPLGLEFRERVQMIGVLALFALIIVVTVGDVGRIEAIKDWLGG